MHPVSIKNIGLVVVSLFVLVASARPAQAFYPNCSEQDLKVESSSTSFQYWENKKAVVDGWVIPLTGIDPSRIDERKTIAHYLKTGYMTRNKPRFACERYRDYSYRLVQCVNGVTGRSYYEKLDSRNGYFGLIPDRSGVLQKVSMQDVFEWRPRWNLASAAPCRTGFFYNYFLARVWSIGDLWSPPYIVLVRQTVPVVYRRKEAIPLM